MRVATSITTDDLASIGATAAELEDRGYDELQSQEGRHDPFIPLTLAAARTERIGLATNVAVSFPRSPMVAAVASWDLQSLSGGRFTLGLGSQIRPHNERRYSMPWSAPAPRMREYVQSMKAIFSTWETGERLRFEGDHYTFTLMTPNFTPPPLDGPAPRIHLAAVGPNMLATAGRVSDGANLHPFCTRPYLTDVIVPRLESALADSGRTRADFAISGGGFIATGTDDEAVDRSIEWVRQRIGFYGSTPSYWPVLELHDLLDLGHRLNAMSKAGEWDAMTAAVTDDVLELFCAHGTHDAIAGEIASHFGGVVDAVGVDNDVPGEVIEAIHAI
ncbi:MAG: TIGR03617 family F420-dependent LLM class oxidoreductase [Actinomycetota bacterium]